MSERIEGLLVEISADIKDFKSKMGQVKEESRDTELRLKDLGASVRNSVNELAKVGAAAAGALAVGAAAMVKSNLTAIKELKAQAEAAGLTVEQLQKGAFAASQFGIEQEKYSDILKDVNDRIGDFINTGAGPMTDFFEKIGPKVGVTIDDFKKLNSEEALGLYIKSLEKANLSQAEMTFFMEAIASDSTRLIPLFAENGKKMNELQQAAEELGIGLSEIDVAQAIEAQKQLDAIAAVTSNELMKAAADLAPLVTVLLKEFQEVTKEVGGFSSVAMEGFSMAAKGVGIFADGIHGLKVLAKGVEVVFRGLAAVIAGSFSTLVGGLVTFSNMVKDAVIFPIRESLEVLAPFSDTAAEALEKVEALSESLKAKVPDAIREFSDAQFQALDMAKQELADAALEELPSQSIEKFIQDIETKVQGAKERIKAEQVQTEGGEQTRGLLNQEPEQKSAVEQFQEETVGLLEAMGLRFQMQEEAQLAANERELEILKQHLEAKKISQAQYEEEVSKIERKSAEIRRGMMVKNLQDGFKLLAENSSKVQKIMKASAIVQAVIKGKQAAVDAWQAGMSTGGPFAPLVAAAYTAASLAKTASLIQSIKSGGNSIPSGGGGSVPTPTAASAPSAPAASASSGSGQPRIFNINFEGQSQIPTEQVRSLIELFGEEMGNNMKLNFEG